MNISFSTRSWGIIFTALSATVLAAVFISQYGFGFHPCHLCLLQRIPYYISTVMGMLLIVLADRKTIATMLLWLLALCFAGGMGLAIFHVGVEYKWWTYNSGCSGGNIFQSGSTADILKALKSAPVIRCDERVPFLFGMTMAFYNALTSAGLTLLALFALSCNSSRG